MSESKFARTRVLIAEDSATQREEILGLLELHAFVTFAAKNGHEALEIAKRERPDLIISDVMMPGMTGFELCRAIRHDENLRDTPVILVTSLSSPTDVFLGLECGADNFITKPYDEKYLISRIDYILANRELRKSGKLQIGIEIELGGERHFINAERQQILDLLVSTYEQAVRLNEQVQEGHELLEQSYETLDALYRLSQGLNVCIAEEEVAAQALKTVLALPDAASACVVFRGEDGEFTVVEENSPANGTLHSAALDLCRSRERGFQFGRDDEASDIQSNGARYAIAPIVTDRMFAGGIVVSGRTEGESSRGTLKTLSAIGRQVSVALERVRLHHSLEVQVEMRTAELRREFNERRLAETRLADAIDSISEGFILYDKDDRVVLFNKTAREFFPFLPEAQDSKETFEEILRKGVVDPRYPHLRARDDFVEAKLERHRAATGEPFEEEFADGRWFLVTEMRTRDGGVVGVRTDITPLKQAQLALGAQAQRQMAIAKLGQRALSSVSSVDLVTEAVETVAEILNVPLVKVLAPHPANSDDLVMIAGHGWPNEYRDGTPIARAARSPVGYTMERRASVVVANWASDPRFDVPDPLLKNRVVSGAMVPIPGATSNYGVLGIDTTTAREIDHEELNFLQSIAHLIGVAVQREEREQKLREANEQISTILDSSPVAIATIDTEWNVVSWNRAAESTFGYATEEVIGSQYPLVLTGAAGEVIDLQGRLTSGAELDVMQVMTKSKPGKPLHLTLSAARLFGADGEVAGVIIVHEDVTARKTIEAQLFQAQKLEAVGKLTGGIAHDFNNILMVIIGNLDFVEESFPEGSENRELMATALKAALRGAELTHQLLAYARRQELNPALVDVNAMLGETVKLLERTLGEDIDIHLSLGEGAWKVMVDPAQLNSAIMNLAVNARDAMPNGGDLFIVTRNGQADEISWLDKPDVTPGDYLIIEMTDSGTGIPPEVLEQIFEPFFTTKEAGKGTGLGLAMLYGFVKQSGGHVTVYSEVGKGTTFRIYLQRAGNDRRDGRKSGSGTAADPSGRGERILVVEDNASVRGVVVRKLTELGYDVWNVSDGAAALRFLEEHDNVDLVFSDMVMPGGTSGQDIALAVAHRWPGVKVLLTSGYPEMAVKRRENIAAELISKPYRLSDLAAKIREVLEAE